MLPAVTATRFVAPLREGGSLPGLIEADDLGMYVVKFRGAGQGLKVLVAEVICTGLARALGIRTPDIATVTLPPAVARYEADEEVQDLLNASPGSNLAIDFLPGAFGYDGSRPPTPDVAARILFFDAFVANVDRTWANPNLLTWGGHTWAIDHGAALYFHHTWPSREPGPDRFAAQRFDATRHVLAGVVPDLAAAMAGEQTHAAGVLDRATLTGVVSAVPDEWLEPNPWLTTPEQLRQAYVDHLAARLTSPAAWLPGEGGAR